MGKQNGSDINELEKLRHLWGECFVLNLQNVKVDPSKDISSHKKKHLEELTLEWHGDSEDSLHERSLLERLQHHTTTKKVQISGNGGTKFAIWVGNPSYKNMVWLKLH